MSADKVLFTSIVFDPGTPEVYEPGIYVIGTDGALYFSTVGSIHRGEPWHKVSSYIESSDAKLKAGGANGA